MDYLKIIETAQKCEVKKHQISEYYRLMGANRQLPEETTSIIKDVIGDLEDGLEQLKTKLRRHIS